MPSSSNAIERANNFSSQYSLRVPILMAPMAGACPTSLAIAVADGGGMGACGALLMNPDKIGEWARDMRAGSNGAFQMNLWIPDPKPIQDSKNEAALREFLSEWGPEVPQEAVNVSSQDFSAQCEAMIQAGPSVISSIMGLYNPDYISKMKENNIKWFATVTTVSEAVAAEAAGADVIVAQGMEAGGHRGAFNADDASTSLVGLFSLLPAIVDAVEIPVVATGGISDERGIAAALLLGASAVQIGTGLLRTPEAGISPVWADAIGTTKPEDTVATRAFSGRLGRSIKSEYTDAASSAMAPKPAPYPIQRSLTQAMRNEATATSDIGKMQAWAGQSAMLAKDNPAAELVTRLWEDAQSLLSD